jgi:hypothetical protein
VISSASIVAAATPAPTPPAGSEPPSGTLAYDDEDEDEEEGFTLGVDRHGAPLDLGGGSLVIRLSRLKAAAAAGRVSEGQYRAELKMLLRTVAQENAVVEAVGVAQRFGCDMGHPLERNRSTTSSWRCACSPAGFAPPLLSPALDCCPASALSPFHSYFVSTCVCASVYVCELVCPCVSTFVCLPLSCCRSLCFSKSAAVELFLRITAPLLDLSHPASLLFLIPALQARTCDRSNPNISRLQSERVFRAVE